MKHYLIFQRVETWWEALDTVFSGRNVIEAVESVRFARDHGARDEEKGIFGFSVTATPAGRIEIDPRDANVLVKQVGGKRKFFIHATKERVAEIDESECWESLN